MRVSISGPPGSGKSTMARLVAKSLKLRLIMTGKVFRSQARQAGMDVHKYNQLAEKDKAIDEKLDDEILRLAQQSDKVLVEGRLAGHLLHMKNIPSFKVYVTASGKIRAERIAKREKTKPEYESQTMAKRESSEKSRYKDFYGIDISDMSIYDLVVDTSDLTAEEAAKIVVDEIGKMRR